jgi:SAM-dependent methyltransferase
MSYISYERLTPEQCLSASSETSKYRHLTAPFCRGAGVDIASQGDAVVPWAISFDLPVDEFLAYSGGHPPKGPIHLRGHADNLPFDSDSLDFVYSSHLLEDYVKEDRWRVVAEWARVVKPGGHVVILVPEVERWNYCVQVLGQCPNCSHKTPEPSLGDLSDIAQQIGMEVIKEELTQCYPGDYTIIAVLRKPGGTSSTPSSAL